MPTLEHTFDSEVQLASIQTDITGEETATLTESDYSESGTGPFTYTTTYEATTDGEFTFTITNAETSAAEAATWGGQSAVITTSSVTIIDDFEDGDISEYSGDTGAYEATTDEPVFNGDFSLEATGSNAKAIYSTSGLNSYPERGDSFRVRFNMPEENNVGVIWGGPDIDNKYRTVVFGQYNTFRFWEDTDGTETQLATDDDVQPPIDEWGYIEVTYGDPTITLALYDSEDTLLSEIEADDTTHNHTGFGFIKSSWSDSASSTSAYDYAIKI